MVVSNKQTMQQSTFLDTGWNVLLDEKRAIFENGIEGVIRSMIPSIPIELLQELYKDGDDHRPVEYAAQYVMALIYMKVCHIQEEYFLSHIHSDPAMQYALMTENERKQPFSDRTFSRLRARLKGRYEVDERDILQEITDILNFAMEMEVIGSEPYDEIHDKMYRMDSLNVDMHGAHKTRLQLVYIVNRINVQIIEACEGKERIPDSLQHYLDKTDHNRITYYKGTLAEVEAEAAKRGISLADIEAELNVESDQSASTENIEKENLEQSCSDEKKDAAEDADGRNESIDNRKKRNMLIGRLRLQYAIDESFAIKKLVEKINKAKESKEYQLLVQLIEDQTKIAEDGTVVLRENSEIKGSSMQSPYETEATARTKDRKTTQGYSANVVQRMGKGDYAIIVDRDIQPNIHSDQAYAKDFYQKFAVEDFDPDDASQKWNGICVDGLYCNSYELKELARISGFKVYCGTITGIMPDPILAEFQVDPVAETVQACPEGHAVKRAKFGGNIDQVRIRMPVDTCSKCPKQKNCGSTILKNGEGSLLLKIRQYEEAKTLCNLGDPKYRELVNKRNAVEGIPSILRRAYHIDDTIYFGMWYARYDLMLSTTAANLRVLLRYRHNLSKPEATKENEES